MAKIEEIWKPVVGFEGYYEVSNLGNVRSVDRIIYGGKWGQEKRKSVLLKANLNRKLVYKYVILVKCGVRKTMKIHRLVAMAFIPNPENKRDVNHKDLDKTNNTVENLEWVTPTENRRHAIGLFRGNFGVSVPFATLNPEKVKEIRYIHRTGIATCKELKIIYKVADIKTIYNVVNRRFWKNV